MGRIGDLTKARRDRLRAAKEISAIRQPTILSLRRKARPRRLCPQPVPSSGSALPEARMRRSLRLGRSRGIHSSHPPGLAHFRRSPWPDRRSTADRNRQRHYGQTWHPGPKAKQVPQGAIERALAKPGLAVVALIGSRSHSAADVSAALEAAAREANVFQ